MLNYAIQRVALFLPTLLVITLISFSIMHLAPGDPVDLFVGGMSGGDAVNADERGNLEETRRALREQLGLDKPLYVQYLTWLSNLIFHVESLDSFDRGAKIADRILGDLSDPEFARIEALDDNARKAALLNVAGSRSPGDVPVLESSSFWRLKKLKMEGNYERRVSGLLLGETETFRITSLNFGRSFKDQRAVIDRILERLPVTLKINVISLMIAYLIGVPLGIYQSIRQNSPTDRTLTTFTFALWSMPSFWVGMLLIIFFCNKEFFYLFPASGIQSLEVDGSWTWWARFTDHAHHMVLPILASSYASFAAISRYMRTSMLENLRMDYVRTARAKGLREKTVILRHVLRNSLIPIVTLFAYLLPGLIAGSVFIETIFTIPGLGYMAFESVLVRDYPMIMALFTIGSVLSLVSILLADIMLKVVDPRIEFSRAPT